MSKKISMKRINLNLPEKLVDQIDDLADDQYLTRSAMITSILSQYMAGQKNLELLSQVIDLAKAQNVLPLDLKEDISSLLDQAQA